MTASGAQYDASVPAVDGPNDLALLKAGGGHREPATLRAPRRAILGEPVTVAGFPLSGLLADGLNVTGGEISALAGPANDARVMQITAPVQSGNGGGPPLDKSGRVIGVAVSKPDAPEVYGVTGELPQTSTSPSKARRCAASWIYTECITARAIRKLRRAAKRGRQGRAVCRSGRVLAASR